MTFSDPNGRQWLHHLRVERSGTNATPEEVAKYLLSYLLLDDIDESGDLPPVQFAAFAKEQFVSVYWNHAFSFEEVQTMCRATLPDQLVGLVDDDVEVIGAVWYDEVEVHWLPEV
jgi:hypothetical protein